jgi:hypothetical protein
MWRQDFGVTRKNIRVGGGRDVEPEHYDEVLGSSEFCIYIPPNVRMKGYDDLKAFLEGQGCVVEYPGYSEYTPNKSYSVIAITMAGQRMSDAALRKAHRWAHKRNYLHSFFRPF